jgi:type II secretory pathway pseudopilin PulG
MGLMFLIVVIGIGLAAAGMVWQTEVQREKEKELLFIGEQFRQAIGSYYENTPAGIKQYPPSLEDLLHDSRFPEMQRHLRRIYPDPVTGNADWGLLKEQQRIVGVYSKSETGPLMKVFTGEGRQGFSDAVTYAGWAFVYKPTNSSASASPAVPATPVVAGSTFTVPVTPPQNNAQPGTAPTPAPPSAGNSDDPCARQAASDYASCIETCKLEPFGICTACYASLRERTLACKQNKSLPELITK